MDYSNLRTLKKSDLLYALKAALVPEKYDNNSMSGEPTWSLTELIENPGRECTFAALLLYDVSPEGGVMTPGIGIENRKREVRLQVLSRQACDFEVVGNSRKKLEKNPCEEGFVAPMTPPIVGDIIRIKGQPYEICPDTRRHMDKRSVRSARIRRERDCHQYTEYSVDKHGCVTMSLEHAFVCLKNNGYQLNKPEFQDWNSNLLDGHDRVIKDPKRRVCNWHFKEVSSTFKPKLKNTSGQPESDQATNK